jgi:hypothetical protein
MTLAYTTWLDNKNRIAERDKMLKLLLAQLQR